MVKDFDANWSPSTCMAHPCAFTPFFVGRKGPAKRARTQVLSRLSWERNGRFTIIGLTQSAPIVSQSRSSIRLVARNVGWHSRFWGITK